MAESRRVLRITELENDLRGLEFLLRQLDKVDEMDVPTFLSDTGYISKLEIESSVAKVTQSLRKAKREQVESEEREDAASYEKYPLIDVPDNMLTPEQLKDKKRQQFLKTTAEGRQRARHKRFEEEALRDRENQLEEEMRLYATESFQISLLRNEFVIKKLVKLKENPELYLEQLHARHKELIEKVEQRKRLKTNGNGYSSNGNGYSSNGNSGGVGRGERLNAAQKERMRLLTTAAFDRGKGEDTFGAKDDDWELYKLMSKDHDDEDEGQDEDELELSRLSSKLQVLDPSFVLKLEFAESQPFDVPKPRLLTEEDFKISLGVERFRCPEILFRPNLVGIDQVGLDEMVGVSVRRFTLKGQGFEEKLTSSILLTGGSCLYPGMAERLEAGVRMILPCGTPIRIVRALDPVMDAWRGASTFAASLCFPSQTFSKMDYDERGEVGLHGYKFRYTI
ncbi:Actin-related protein [Drosera capensis]